MKAIKVFTMAVTLFICCSCGDNNQSAVHKGSFVNQNQQQAKDLHIIFDKEGVTYEGGESKTKMSSRDPVNKDGKTEIDLDGDINPNSSAFGQVFKRKDGDFKIEKYWWTTKEGNESVKLGDEHSGPPNADDNSGDWK